MPYRDATLYGPATLDSRAARAAALQAAEESIVLLKNDALRNGQRLLPLAVPTEQHGARARPLRVGVVGPTAEPTWQPDDKNDYCSAFTISPLHCLQ